jgi:SNF2 family DNA or RNA helicase
MVQSGDKVRKSANPGRIGFLGRERSGPPERERGLVHWSDNNQEEYVLLASLEKVGDIKQGPYELIIDGKYGRVKDLRGAITYHRLSGKLANLIYSLNTTNTQFFPYQFKPVLQFLDSPSNSILIADEVGLGKTIEAGLIWTELRAREDARRLLVICPAMLRQKWKEELDLRFGVKAELVDAMELLEKLKYAQNQPHETFALIASYQGTRPPSETGQEAKRVAQSAKLADFLEEMSMEEPLLDLVIFDEAHYLRNRQTRTYKLANLLRPVVQNMVMLSATPIQLKSTDLFALLHLLDEEAFPFEWSFEYQIRANEPIIRLRDRTLAGDITSEEFITVLGEISRQSLLEDSEQIEYFQKNPPSTEHLSTPRGRSEVSETLDRLNPLTKIVTRTLKRDVQENRVVREPKLIHAQMSPPETVFYQAVTDQVREYCSDMDVSEGFLLTTPQRQMASCMAAACKRWRKRLESQEFAEEEDVLFELDADDLTSNARSQQGKSTGPLLENLIQIVQSVGDFEFLKQHDSKYAVLRSTLKDYWRQYPGRKVVLFSFFKDTLHYLSERLAEDGISSVVLHGELDKHEALQKFASEGGPKILLSSEVASEGVDLQFSSVLINYDLPWNPAKIEQRIGRIDRIGQQEEKILIWNLVYKDTVDDRVCERLLNRLNTFERALGSMEAILGDEIRALTQELLTHKLSSEQEEARIDKTKVAIESNARMQQVLEAEAANLIAHGDFIQNKVRAANELGRYIRGEDLFAYINDYFLATYPGTLISVDPKRSMLCKIGLSIEAHVKLSDFLQDNYLQSKTAILTQSPPLFLFENKLGARIPGVERITQDHPLVRFVSYDQIKSGKSGLYSEVVAAQTASPKTGIDAGLYVYAVARWSVSGSRTVERLEYSVRRVSDSALIPPDDAELLVNTTALNGHDWLAARNGVDGKVIADLQEKCCTELEDAFQYFSNAYKREDADRIRMMVKTLSDHHQKKVSNIQQRIAAAKASGDERRIKNIPSQEGKLKKQQIRIDQKIAELMLKMEGPTHQSTNIVTSGVIRVI